MGVIWCNSLGDSHFQICVMNNVKIVLDYYLQIISHVSHAFTCCTHFTSYYLLSFVHGIVCESSLAIQDYVFYGAWCKICLRVGENCVFDDWKSCFWSFGLKTNVFEKLLNSFSCISFMKLFRLSVFCINFYSFSKNSDFQNFDWSNVFLDRSKFPWFLIMIFCLAQLIFDRCSNNRNWEIFNFSVFDLIFFIHHLYLRFTCIALFSISILQFYRYISHRFHT